MVAKASRIRVKWNIRTKYGEGEEEAGNDIERLLTWPMVE